MAGLLHDRDTAVYVHFPWCAKKCPYCDFATRAVEPASIDHEGYADAIARDLEARQPQLDGRRLVSVFFGGGTPSLWSADALGRTLERIRGAFDSEVPDLEITAECNPSSLSAEQAQGFADAGINRTSIGVQSLQQRHLQFLGRLHDGPGALRALRDAKATGVRVSADLMFGMRDQRDVLADVDVLIAEGLDHVSAYALTIEAGTQFGTLQRLGKLETADEDDYARMFLETEARFAAAGLDHYEVSNYARPGQEARHNQHYWRGGDYLALGAAAVGCLSDSGVARRWRNQSDPQRYLAEPVEEWSEQLESEERIQEALMLGLRTTEGVELDGLAERVGIDPRVGRERALDRALERGDLSLDEAVLTIPRQRWLRLDGIVASLF